jgi:hypothetical protein
MKEAYYHQRYIAAGALVLFIALAAAIGSVDSTTSFRVCFGVLLLMCCVAQLTVAMDLYNNIETIYCYSCSNPNAYRYL